MISQLSMLAGLMALCALPACAQAGSTPVFASMPDAPYPLEARTARLSGEVKIAFSIASSGRTTAIHAVSGPPVLIRAMQDEIRGWRFVTPLPHGAERDFIADYEFSVIDSGGLDGTAKISDRSRDVEPGYVAAVTGVVRSVDNRQTIDATPLVRSR